MSEIKKVTEEIKEIKEAILYTKMHAEYFHQFENIHLSDGSRRRLLLNGYYPKHSVVVYYCGSRVKDEYLFIIKISFNNDGEIRKVDIDIN